MIGNPQRSLKEVIFVLVACFFVLGGIGATLYLSAQFVAIPLFGPEALNLGRIFGVDDVLGFLAWLFGSMIVGGVGGAVAFMIFLKLLDPQKK